MNKEQLDRLLAAGSISQETYNTAMAGQPATDMDRGEEEITAERPLEIPANITNPMNDMALAPTIPEEPAETPLQPLIEPPELDPTLQQEQTLSQTVIAPTETGRTEVITSQEKLATPEAKEAQAELETAMKKEQTGLEAEVKVNTAIAADRFNLNQEQQKIEQDFGAETQKIKEEGNKIINDRLTQLDNEIESLSKQEYEGYWTNKGTGNKILAAISIGLGAFGSSMSGGPNYALNIINKAMDDEFKQYQDSVKNKIKAIEKSKLNTEQKRRLIGDQIIALEAKKQSDVNVIKNKITNLSDKFADPNTKAKLDQLNAQLDQKVAKSRLEFEKNLGETFNTSVKRQIASVRVDPKTGEVSPSPASFKDEQSFRKEVGADPIIKKATDTLSQVASADKAMDLVRKGDSGAIGTVTTMVAGSVQSGVLTDEDVKRASGAPLGVITKGKDAIDTWILNQPPAEQVRTLEKLLKVTRENAQTQLKDRSDFYKSIAKDRGFKVENILAPAPQQRESKPAPNGQVVRQNGVTYEWDGQKYVRAN